MQPEEGTLEKKWLEDFRVAYRENFDEHKPLFAQVHSVGREWISNLIRLFGRREKLIAILDRLNGVSSQPPELGVSETVSEQP